jgi:hypothetical protein
VKELAADNWVHYRFFSSAVEGLDLLVDPVMDPLGRFGTLLQALNIPKRSVSPLTSGLLPCDRVTGNSRLPLHSSADAIPPEQP